GCMRSFNGYVSATCQFGSELRLGGGCLIRNSWLKEFPGEERRGTRCSEQAAWSASDMSLATRLALFTNFTISERRWSGIMNNTKATEKKIGNWTAPGEVALCRKVAGGDMAAGILLHRISVLWKL